MSDIGDDIAGSPFHAGERELQSRIGVRNLIEAQGRRMIRDFLTDQHREFFPLLSQLVIGAADEQGRPWASLRVGSPGFVHSPNPQTLRVEAPALRGDPLAAALMPGGAIGILGIDLTTRRRNRANGRIAVSDGAGFTVTVAQSFGNCPQYIQLRAREPAPSVSAALPAAPEAFERFDEIHRTAIQSADTFFIASQAADPRTGGVDVSHRGGWPGFVRVEGASTLVFPDFSGNRMFNTLGNLLLDPRAGLVFVDFARGDVLWLTGEAEIIWDGPLVSTVLGAERAIRFQLTAGYHARGVLADRWVLQQYSPTLGRTGVWPEEGG